MTKQEVISKVKGLNLAAGSYVVFGGAPLAAVGIREAKDIDLLVSPEAFKQLKKAGWQELYKAPGDEPLTYDVFEAHEDWNFSPYSPTLEHLRASAMIVEGVPFASIEEVRRWKAASGRPNDLVDLELIEKYLINKRIARAQELLRSVKHAAMATVNLDGSPHNTPFYFIRDPKLEYIYWSSHPNSLHSENVLRTGQIFVVLYDAIERGGLYMSAEKGHIPEGEELATALGIHNAQRASQGKDQLDMSYYDDKSSQRMWAARITHFWVNSAERDENGHVLKDGRQEIGRENLLVY